MSAYSDVSVLELSATHPSPAQVRLHNKTSHKRTTRVLARLHKWKYPVTDPETAASRLLVLTKTYANSGPMNTVAEKTAIAKPLASLPNISAKIAAVIAKGADPKKPLKNLHNMIVCKSCAVATAIVNKLNPNAATSTGRRRP